jgi:hypothetical protein
MADFLGKGTQLSHNEYEKGIAFAILRRNRTYEAKA